ncbi:DUF2285 domain-containing protein [Sphingomonas paeninsulae]|uniref:DUF2285 domain-containing protein n=1 Tax=Sphingomonas paeninsulae TaxID=2319844 RepID=A0A494TK45_SPHPE|nr:DUF2285 domain-containing protein [Sphingomonas paeninsulae]AYJ87423.1 DUF2285 domain-containing protein [Sphingomonas paeninsulae]
MDTGQPGLPDWSRAQDYAHLVPMPRSAFAWEWLRRSSRYRDAWSGRSKRAGHAPWRTPESFGLIDYEDPRLDAKQARPLWSGAIDPTVLTADVLDRDPGPRDAFDLRKLASLAKLRVGTTIGEHVLISDGTHGIRLDIATGSVVGSPALLAYRIDGLISARAPAETLQRLTELVQRQAFLASAYPRERRANRWILELRTADAIATGATARDIALHFYPALTSDRRWRTHSGAARRRVQRLIARARGQQVDADVARWFAGADPIQRGNG